MAKPSQGGTVTSKPQVTYQSKTDLSASKPDLRLIHYNDVYHVDQQSAEPVGGLPRFITVCKEYQVGAQFEGQPQCLTLFSGDAFNPSLESSVTKGRHMVPALNAIKTDVACVGNHDFDFGIKQFQNLTGKCNFPWLLANVIDLDLGEDVPMGGVKKTHLLTTSNGVKVGFIGLGEREWLETINSVPPNILYKSASQTAKEIAPKLREQGAEIVICLSHMREPNDNKLAEQTDGLIDIILGGHDHYYSHSFIKGTHVLRSGTDFKNLSYIEARRSRDKPGKWDFDIWRRDVTSDVPEHEETRNLVNQLTSKLQSSLSRAVGWTAMPLDARFNTVRLSESNIGNFVCDVMRHFHNADCTIMAAGTIRGDQVYPPGAIRIKDITTCFPFEDPAVLLRVKGQAIWDALENGVYTYPALEGRFPQVSGLQFEFDPRKPPGKRITRLDVGDVPYDPEKKYLLSTRGYMGRGKDGYTSLLVQSEGGEAEELIDEENGVLISTILRQYFMALRTLGRWEHLAQHFIDLGDKCKGPVEPAVHGKDAQRRNLAQQAAHHETSDGWKEFLHRRLGLHHQPLNEESHMSDDNDDQRDIHNDAQDEQMEYETLLLRKFWGKWIKKIGKYSKTCDPLKDNEYNVDWTRVIAPRLEGRIKIASQ